MTPKIEITDAAVEAMRNVFNKTYLGGTEVPYRAALAAALPFCKLGDAEPQFYAVNRHGVRILPGEVILEKENGRLYTLEAVYSDVVHAYTETGELCELPPAAIPGLSIRRAGETGPRLRLFDGRFTLPLIVQSFPGVSFIHPANNESAPVAVVTCDDHPTIAAGIVDAIRVASDAATEERRKEWKASVSAFHDSAAAAFREANAEAMKAIRAACGPDLDKSWAEKARELFGDQKRSTLLVIGAALAKIAAALPGRVHIEVGYPEPTCRNGIPDIAPEVHGWVVPRWRDYAVFLSAANMTEAEVKDFAMWSTGQGGNGEYYPVAKILTMADMPSTGDEDKEWAEASAHLNCPACGGSGHVDDIRKAIPDAWIRTEDSRLLAKGHVVTVYPHPGAFTEYLPVYLSAPPLPDPDFEEVPEPANDFADTSHMSGYTDKGIPRHGGTAMRQGWKLGANPWFRRDGALSWEAALWCAQWHFENAECMKSHIEGEGFKPLPPVQGIGE